MSDVTTSFLILYSDFTHIATTLVKAASETSDCNEPKLREKKFFFATSTPVYNNYSTICEEDMHKSIWEVLTSEKEASPSRTLLCSAAPWSHCSQRALDPTHMKTNPL